MKKFIILGICILSISIIIPGLIFLNGAKDTDFQSPDNQLPTVSTEKIEISHKDRDTIVCSAMEYIDISTLTETKKAVLALCKNNFIVSKNKNSTDTLEVSNYSDELYEELCDLYKNLKVEIRHKSTNVYIPITKQSGPITSTSDEFPYMESVASPWDAFTYDYSTEATYPCGVSIHGINHLCSEGLSFDEALHWYLPNFEIIVQ